MEVCGIKAVLLDRFVLVHDVQCTSFCGTLITVSACEAMGLQYSARTSPSGKRALGKTEASLVEIIQHRCSQHMTAAGGSTLGYL